MSHLAYPMCDLPDKWFILPDRWCNSACVSYLMSHLAYLSCDLPDEWFILPDGWCNSTCVSYLMSHLAYLVYDSMIRVSYLTSDLVYLICDVAYLVLDLIVSDEWPSLPDVWRNGTCAIYLVIDTLCVTWPTWCDLIVHEWATRCVTTWRGI